MNYNNLPSSSCERVVLRAKLNGKEGYGRIKGVKRYGTKRLVVCRNGQYCISKEDVKYLAMDAWAVAGPVNKKKTVRRVRVTIRRGKTGR